MARATVAFKMKEEGHEPRNLNSLWNLQSVANRFFLSALLAL